MSRKGFTLIELMVTVVIVGILASIAVPKMFGHTARAKAAEVTPAAATYIKLQQVYKMEFKGVGTWKRIGYEPPGKGETSNFRYSKGFVTHVVKKNNLNTTFAGEGKSAWVAENIVGLDNCYLGNKWVVYIVASGDDHDLDFKMKVDPSSTAQSCAALTGSDWEVATSEP